jgi:hypothetical protein
MMAIDLLMLLVAQERVDVEEVVALVRRRAWQR